MKISSRTLSLLIFILTLSIWGFAQMSEQKSVQKKEKISIAVTEKKTEERDRNSSELEKNDSEEKEETSEQIPNNAQENQEFIPLSNENSVEKLVLSAPKQNIEVTLLETLPVSEVERLTNRFYSSNAPAAKFSVKKYRIRFQTIHDGGRVYPAQAEVYIPQTEEAVNVIGSSAGTTGIFDQCAPSKENISVANWGDYHGHHAGFAGQGYAVVFPDYSGFNDIDTLHHYFVADFEARVVLDGLRALYDSQEELGVTLQENIVLSGYSQGAHAALAAADLWKEYAPNLPIKGVIGYGAANNTIDLLLHNGYLGPYLFYAYNDLYGDEVVFPPAVLQGWVNDSLKEDLQACIGKVLQIYGRDIDNVYQPNLTKALRNGTMATDYPAFTEKLIQNTSGYGDWNLPVLVAQGVDDPITPISTQKKMMKRFCLTDKPVTYLELASANHYDIRQKTLPQVLQWVKAVIDGQDTPNYCTDLSL